MKSFKELIRELDSSDELFTIQEAVAKIKPPFLIATGKGSNITIKKEVNTDDIDRQERILSKYLDSLTTWIIPSRNNSDLNIGDCITKKELRSLNAIPLQQFTEEVEECDCESCKSTAEELDEFTINEAVAKKVIRIRNGKRVVLWLCPAGHHKVKKGGKTCVRTTGSQAYKKKRSAKKAARTRKGKQATINRRRSRSVRKRKGMGL